MRRTRRFFIIFITTLFVLVGGIALWGYARLKQDPPHLAPVTGELIFMSDRDGDWDIYRLDTAGVLRNLTADSAAHEYFPSFTFDGEQISLFSTATGAITPARVRVDGTGFETQDLVHAMLTVLAEGETDWDPVWNPGGDRLAWARLLPGLPPQVDLFVANADGTNRLQLTHDAALDGMHAWSPDGARLVYVSNAGGSFNNTYAVNLADGAITRLTAHDAHDYAPFWSQDGSRILVIFSFEGALLEGVLDMRVMNADGSDLHPLGAGEVFTGDLTYAPDGQTVAYVSNESGHWHIYLMDADGSHVRQITQGDSNNLYPAWRPVPAHP
jgi:Tol biopolymer transport system component